LQEIEAVGLLLIFAMSYKNRLPDRDLWCDQIVLHASHLPFHAKSIEPEWSGKS
jgi:hypothetical protein